MVQPIPIFPSRTRDVRAAGRRPPIAPSGATARPARTPRRGQPARPPRRLPAPRRSRSPLVAVLAGGACSCPATRSAARPAPSPARRRRTSDAFQPFWDTYHAITDRYAGGEVDRRRADPGRDPGDDRRARRPVLGVPHVGGVPPEPAGHQRPVRGDRRRDRHAGGGRDARAARRSGRTAISSSSRRSPARRPRRPGSWPATSSCRVDGASLDGLTVDEARDRIRGPKGTVVTLTIQRGDGRPIRRSPSRATSCSEQEVDEQGPRRRDRRLHPADAASPTHAANEVDDGARGARRRPAGRSSSSTCAATPAATSPRPATIASQFIGSGVDLLGGGREGQPGRDRRRRPTASRPTRRSRSSSSSTAAARRPARSSPAPSRTRSGRRSSASSRSARAPSSSGRS